MTALHRYDDHADVFAHPARLLATNTPDPATMERIRASAMDPSIFDGRTPFVFRAQISSSVMDAYYTRMSPRTTLKNFAADAEAGVSFQDSHRLNALGFGRSIQGEYLNANDTGDPPRVQAAFYTLPGLQLNGVSTDHLIDGIRSGIVKDVSVGFYGGSFICSVCGRDMLRDWDCPHIPGVEYEVRSDDGDSLGPAVTKLAFAWVEDARLSEVSAVFDGATPGAAILKANQEAAAGRMRPEAVQLIEARYRIHLPSRRVLVPGVEIQENDMTKRETQVTTSAPVTPAASESEETTPAAAETERAVTPQAPPTETVSSDPWERATELTRQLDDARAEIARLRPLADDGRAYRADLVEQAITEGIRAYGNAFPVETYRAMLEGQSLEAIKRVREMHKEVADKAIPTGRTSVDRSEKAPAPTRKNDVPDAAFAA